MSPHFSPLCPLFCLLPREWMLGSYSATPFSLEIMLPLASSGSLWKVTDMMSERQQWGILKRDLNFLARNWTWVAWMKGETQWSSGEESTWQWRRFGFEYWGGKIPWEGKDNPLQYSWLGNPMDREAQQAMVHGVSKESDRIDQLNNNKTKSLDS